MFSPQSARVRLPHKVPAAVVELVNEKAENHIPTPKARHFYQFLLEMGMDDYVSGTPLERELLPRPENQKDLVRFPHYVNISHSLRLNELHAEHLPRTAKRAFFEYLIMLGLQAYEREYTIYGFRKD